MNLIKELSNFKSKKYFQIASKAKESILYSGLPSWKDIEHKMEGKFLSIIERDAEEQKKFTIDFASKFATQVDIIPKFFNHQNPTLQHLSMEIYIRRIYESGIITSCKGLSKTVFQLASKIGDGIIWTLEPRTSSSNSSSNEQLKNKKSHQEFEVYINQDVFSSDETSISQNVYQVGMMLNMPEFVLSSLLLENSGQIQNQWLNDTMLFMNNYISKGFKNVLYVAFSYVYASKLLQQNTKVKDLDFDEFFIKKTANYLSLFQKQLSQLNLKRITFLSWYEENPISSAGMRYYTFRESLNFSEDCTLRHIEPAMAYVLELQRISKHHDNRLCYADPSGQVHIYAAEPKKEVKTIGSNYTTLFIRIIIRPLQTMIGKDPISYFGPESARLLDMAFSAVRSIKSKTDLKPQNFCNHIFFNILPVFNNSSPTLFINILNNLLESHRDNLWNLRILQGEIRLLFSESKEALVKKCRFTIRNETGFINQIGAYTEEADILISKSQLSINEESSLEQKSVWKLKSFLPIDPFNLDGASVLYPYNVFSKKQLDRYRAHLLDTVFVDDIPELFKFFNKNLLFIQVSEYLNDDDLLKKFNGSEDEVCGIVAWIVFLKCEDQKGSVDTNVPVMIVVANNIVHEIGSFGPKEDILWAASCMYATKHKIPFVFLCANSGARIGLAEDLKKMIQVKWDDSAEKSKQVPSYLFLLPADYERVISKVKCEAIYENNQLSHYKILDIIGSWGIGVENLSGSGWLAGEMSRAYNKTFTISYVTGRAVGIGAYLVRLGNRIIQKSTQPIILTGVASLNALLGKDVYSSNLQIGGPHIMASNGISQRVVTDDLAGIREILMWIEVYAAGKPYTSISCKQNTLNSIFQRKADVWDRDVKLITDSEDKDDPRHFIRAFLDEGSWWEVMPDWARSVVCGRGFLGGIPLAVISPEGRTTKTNIPSDPGCPTSLPTTTVQPGGVWFPDSAYKTAQVISDANREGIPLLIIAAWRGFSGGQNDLLQGILKYGSMIVDALCSYRQPVIIYIPPEGELRGGSWVVLDSRINDLLGRNPLPHSMSEAHQNSQISSMIEMYVDPSARGGILEPTAIVNLKFRDIDVLMQRLGIEDRQVAIQVATIFADAHDTPERMLAVGVIKAIVPAINSRRFFYWRLKRRLAEENLWKSECEGEDGLAVGLTRSQFNDLLPSPQTPDIEAYKIVSSVDFIHSVKSAQRQARIQILQKQLEAAMTSEA